MELKELLEKRRADRAAMWKPGSQVWVRAYDEDGNEAIPEPRCVSVPNDVLESGVLPLNLRFKVPVYSLGFWMSPTAGAGVGLREAEAADGFVCSADVSPNRHAGSVNCVLWMYLW